MTDIQNLRMKITPIAARHGVKEFHCLDHGHEEMIASIVITIS